MHELEYIHFKYIYSYFIISSYKRLYLFCSAEDGDKGGEMAKMWESSIRQALMPVVHVTGPQGSVSSEKVGGLEH